MLFRDLGESVDRTFDGRRRRESVYNGRMTSSRETMSLVSFFRPDYLAERLIRSSAIANIPTRSKSFVLSHIDLHTVTCSITTDTFLAKPQCIMDSVDNLLMCILGRATAATDEVGPPS